MSEGGTAQSDSMEDVSGSSSSESDFDGIDASAEDIKALEELRSALAKDPRQYDQHCQVSFAQILPVCQRSCQQQLS